VLKDAQLFKDAKLAIIRKKVVTQELFSGEDRFYLTKFKSTSKEIID